jgi:3-oxoacyl-[acyl-carrier protein] reductase
MSASATKRVVVVTGASRGLGSSIALEFGRAGCRVVVNYLHRHDAAEAVVREIASSGGEAFSWQADVASGHAVEKMAHEVLRRWGRVDVLVNNAGIARDGLILRMNEQDWDDVIRTDLTGPYQCMRAFAPVMIEQGSGHIISINSIVAAQGRQGQANYASAKAGLLGLTRAAAREWGPYGIQVNTVFPGFLLTDMGGTVANEMQAKLANEHLLAARNRPEDVARFVYMLSTMTAVSGQVFNLDSRII